MGKTNNTFTYISGIDGLRAIAVLAVMLFHINPALLPGGFSGVDIFFVISGYVISASLARNPNPDFFKFTLSFYAKRAIRILPALIACLLITGIITTLFVPESWLSSTTKKTGLFAYLGLSNYALVWYNDGYFSPRVDFNPYTHTWSLAVEEQFYIFFPLILFIWMKYRERKNLLGMMAKWLLSGLLILSLVYAYYETTKDPSRAYYLLPSRFWELASGALLFKLHTHNKFLPSSENRARLFLFVGLIFTTLGLIYADKSAFPFPWAILPVIGTVFLISGVLSDHTNKPLIQKTLEGSIFVYIGKISYSLYLWHWPVNVLFRWTIGLDTLFVQCLAIALSFTLAIASYYLVETPIRKSKFSLSRPGWMIITVGVFALVASYQFSKFTYNAQPTISLSVTKDKQIWYPHDWAVEFDAKETQPFSGRQIFVIGDSHTGAYSTMLKKLSDEQGVKVIKFSNGGCGIANLLKPVMVNNSHCNDLIDKQLNTIESTTLPGDILFLASLRMNRFGDQWASFSEKQVYDEQFGNKAIAERKLALDETTRLMRRFEKLKMHIVIDAPKPIFKSPPFRCSDWFNSTNPICEPGFTIKRDVLLLHRQPVMNSLQLLTNDFPNLIIWDPFPLLCATEVCSAFDIEKPLFFDGDHLSAYGNQVLYPSFLSMIETIWLPKSNN